MGKERKNEHEDQKSKFSKQQGRTHENQVSSPIDFGEEESDELQEEDKVIKLEPVSPMDKFILAKWILGVTGLFIFIFAVIHLSVNSDISSDIWTVTFELSKSIILLLMGYYFGVKEKV